MIPIPQSHPSAKAEEDLRTAIALNRGIEWLGKIEEHVKSTRQDYAALKLTHLEELFRDTHHQLFQDWNGNNDKISGENKVKLREALETTFFAKDKQGKLQGLFDENGFAIHFEENAQEKFAEKLAEFYEKAQKIKPYSYGNKLTLDFFMVAVSKLPTVANVYPDGIDFRRLDNKDLEAMSKEPSPDHNAIVTAFKHATDATINYPLLNKYRPQDENGYKVWADQTETISGVPPLLSHTENGIKYLVTMNGGLVKLDDKLKEKLTEHFNNNGLVSDFETFKTDKYLEAPTALPALQEKLNNLRKSKEISGVRIKDGDAPLVFLDVNIMSGLRTSSHNELVAFLQKNSTRINNPDLKDGKEINITALHNKADKGGNKQQKDKFLAPLKERAGNERLKNMLDIAYDRVNANVTQIEKIVKKKFDGKSPQKSPTMYVSMGGSGSGKSIVEKIVKASKCKDNFVISSLDSSRDDNDMHTLLLASGHHADDYVLVNPYAAEIRKRIIDKALDEKFNILCDGSGIDYKGRNDKTIKEFKNKGYHTQVLAVEAFYEDAVKRLTNRQSSQNRAMPWVRVVDKHVNFPLSFLYAVSDNNVDKVSLIAADRGKNEQYLIAETVPQTKDEVKTLEENRKTGLFTNLKAILSNPLSIAEIFKKIEKKDVKDITDIPGFKDENPDKDKNVTFITYPNIGKDGEDRILAVYNASRLSGMMEKGLINQHANSPDKSVLHHTKDELQFYMPEPSDKPGAWQLHLKNQRRDKEKEKSLEIG